MIDIKDWFIPQWFTFFLHRKKQEAKPTHRIIGIVAGKFDPAHEGHIDHIFKASQLCDEMIIITHDDDTIARTSVKKKCNISLYARTVILRGIMRVFDIDGRVIVSYDRDGTVTKTLGIIRKLYPEDFIIFAKGGDRTSSNMPISEIEECEKLNIKIVYGIGDLLNSSSSMIVNK